MGTSYGASKFPSLFQNCILWAPLQHSTGVSGDIDEFPIIPTGVTVTNNGTFTKDDLGNNKSVLKFDGSTNYISLSDNDAWTFGSGDFTIAFWILYATTPSTPQFVLSHMTTGDDIMVLSISPARVVYFQYYSTVVGIVNCNSGTNCLSLNNWLHVTCIRSGSNFNMYFNEMLVGTVSSSIVLQNYTGAFYIGTRISLFPSYVLNANIKDLLIYKGRALTLPEIKLLMNRTNPVTGEGLIDTGKYWRLTA